jgi:hypothetical protein
MVSQALANAINSAKITGGGQLISDTLVNQTKQTITNAKDQAKDAAGNPALNIQTAGQALSDAAKAPFVTVTSFNNPSSTVPNPSTALEKVTQIASSTVQNVDNKGVASLNNTLADINKTATVEQIKNVETATNNIQTIVVKANDTAGKTVTVAQAIAQTVDKTLSNKVDSLANNLEDLSNAATNSIPKVTELSDNIISSAPVVQPGTNIADSIKDVSATNDVATTSSTATTATTVIKAAEPVVINTNTNPDAPKTTGSVIPSYNGESLQLGFGYDFKLCNGICNTSDSYLYEQTREIGGKYIFRCHCKADFSVWFFRENADRFTPCPENDLNKCYLHYFGGSNVVTVAKDKDGHIANPCLNDVILRIQNVDQKIHEEELNRRSSKSFLKPSKADEFVGNIFKPKNSCS